MVATTKKTTAEMILEDLRKDPFGEERTRIAINFATLCNNFSSNYPEITDAIVADSEIFHNFAVFAGACGIMMGYTWECDEKNSYSPHWDDRKKASEKFCRDHMDLFLKVFKDTAGFEFPFREEKEYLSCLRDMDHRSTALTARSALWGELTNFNSEHSTLKQKSMGLFCRILGKGGIYRGLLSNVQFPFI